MFTIFRKTINLFKSLINTISKKPDESINQLNNILNKKIASKDDIVEFKEIILKSGVLKLNAVNKMENKMLKTVKKKLEGKIGTRGKRIYKRDRFLKNKASKKDKIKKNIINGKTVENKEIKKLSNEKIEDNIRLGEISCTGKRKAQLSDGKDFLFFENDLSICYCPEKYTDMVLTPAVCRELKIRNKGEAVPEIIKLSQVPDELADLYYSEENVRKIHEFKDRREREEREKYGKYNTLEYFNECQARVKKARLAERLPKNNKKVEIASKEYIGTENKGYQGKNYLNSRGKRGHDDQDEKDQADGKRLRIQQTSYPMVNVFPSLYINDKEGEKRYYELLKRVSTVNNRNVIDFPKNLGAKYQILDDEITAIKKVPSADAPFEEKSGPPNKEFDYPQYEDLPRAKEVFESICKMHENQCTDSQVQSPRSKKKVTFDMTKNEIKSIEDRNSNEDNMFGAEENFSLSKSKLMFKNSDVKNDIEQKIIDKRLKDENISAKHESTPSEIPNDKSKEMGTEFISIGKICSTDISNVDFNDQKLSKSGYDDPLSSAPKGLINKKEVLDGSSGIINTTDFLGVERQEPMPEIQADHELDPNIKSREFIHSQELSVKNLQNEKISIDKQINTPAMPYENKIKPLFTPEINNVNREDAILDQNTRFPTQAIKNDKIFINEFNTNNSFSPVLLPGHNIKFTSEPLQNSQINYKLEENKTTHSLLNNKSPLNNNLYNLYVQPENVHQNRTSALQGNLYTTNSEKLPDSGQPKRRARANAHYKRAGEDTLLNMPYQNNIYMPVHGNTMSNNFNNPPSNNIHRPITNPFVTKPDNSFLPNNTQFRNAPLQIPKSSTYEPNISNTNNQPINIFTQPQINASLNLTNQNNAVPFQNLAAEKNINLNFTTNNNSSLNQFNSGFKNINNSNLLQQGNNMNNGNLILCGNNNNNLYLPSKTQPILNISSNNTYPTPYNQPLSFNNTQRNIFQPNLNIQPTNTFQTSPPANPNTFNAFIPSNNNGVSNQFKFDLDPSNMFTNKEPVDNFNAQAYNNQAYNNQGYNDQSNGQPLFSNIKPSISWRDIKSAPNNNPENSNGQERKGNYRSYQ